MADARVGVRSVPTLETMASIYRLPREGGPGSARFQAYLRAVRMADGGGLPAYNPMAGSAALDTVERLIENDAEGVARLSAETMIGRCELSAAIELAVVVASPGMWTDRLVTEAEHRLRADRGRPCLVQLWAGESSAPEDVRRESGAEAVRVLWNQFHGPAQDVAAVVAREGIAQALAGRPPEPLSRDQQRAVADALAALAGSRSWQDILGVGYGDQLAAALGVPPPGLTDRAGCRWATERAYELVRRVGAAAALRDRSHQSAVYRD